MAPQKVTALSIRTAPGADTVMLDATQPLRLDSGGGWLVQSGHVDLFAMTVVGGEPSGMRYPLGQIWPGELIAGLPADASHTMIAVGRLGTAVTPLSRAGLAALPEGPRARRAHPRSGPPGRR